MGDIDKGLKVSAKAVFANDVITSQGRTEGRVRVSVWGAGDRPANAHSGRCLGWRVGRVEGCSAQVDVSFF